jgi:hypothetical protein
MKQISIITDDAKAHSVADIAARLAGARINIESLDADGMTANGIILLSVDRYDDALALLREAGYQAMADDAIVVKVQDQPGAVAMVANRFKEANLIIRSMRILRRDSEASLIAIVTEKTPEAEALVADIRVA